MHAAVKGKNFILKTAYWNFLKAFFFNSVSLETNVQQQTKKMVCNAFNCNHSIHQISRFGLVLTKSDTDMQSLDHVYKLKNYHLMRSMTEESGLTDMYLQGSHIPLILSEISEYFTWKNTYFFLAVAEASWKWGQEQLTYDWQTEI